MKRLLAIAAGLILGVSASWGAAWNTGSSNSIVTGLMSGVGADANAITNLPPGEWMRKAYPTPPWFIDSWKRYLSNPYIDEDWATNECYAMLTNHAVAAGWNNLSLSDLGGPTFTRNAAGLLEINLTRWPNGFTNVIAFAHKCGIKVWTYLAASDTRTNGVTGGGNAETPVRFMYSDICQMIDWGFDGCIIDEDGPNLSTEGLRQSGRAACQAIFDRYASEPEGSVNQKRRGMFGLVRAMAPNSDPSNLSAGIYFPYETIDETTVLGAPGKYWGDHPEYFTNNLIEASELINNFAWAIRPGTYCNFGGWNPVGYSAVTNRIRFSFATMCAAPMFIAGGWGEMKSTEVATPYGPFSWSLDATNMEWSTLYRDPAVIPAHVAWSNNLAQIWVRPIGQTNAVTNLVLFINGGTQVSNLTVTAAMLGRPDNEVLMLRELWSHTDLTNFAGGANINCNPTNVVLCVCYPKAARTFDPSQVAGYILDYDFGAQSYPNGAIVDHVVDRGPMHQSAGYLINTYGTHQFSTNNLGELSGKSYVHFDGSALAFAGSNWTAVLPQPLTFYCVFRVSSANAALGVLWTMGLGQPAIEMWYDPLTPTLLNYYSGTSAKTAGFSLDRWQIVKWQDNGAGSIVTTNRELSSAIGTTGVNGLTGMFFGANSSSGQALISDWARCIVLTNVPSAAEDAAMVNYLSTNYASPTVVGDFIGGGAQLSGVNLNGAFSVPLYQSANVTMWGKESPVLLVTGGNSVKLPGAATNYGKQWQIVCVGATGSNFISLPSGTALWTNTVPGRSCRPYSDGTNWWITGAN